MWLGIKVFVLSISKMKRILFIMHSMPIGGAEKVLIDILDNIDYTAYDIDLLLYTNEGELLPKVNKNVRIYAAFEPRKRTLWRRIIGRIEKMLNLVDYIEKKHTRKVIHSNYDCIISFCQGPAHKLHTFLLDRASKHISWVHNDLRLNNWGKLFFHNDVKRQEDAYNMMTDIIFVSNGTKNAFEELFTIDKEVNKKVIYNIVNSCNIREHAKDFVIPKPKDKFLFLNSGRLVEQKAQMRLIEVAKLLKEKHFNFEIWIMGKGPLEAKLQKAIIDDGLSDVVNLIGQKENPYPYMNAADAFVLSSRHEGFSIVVCEALVLGKPIISTKVVGPNELLQDSKYGILVNEDIVSIENAMILLMSDNHIVNHYSKAAIERSKMFDVSTAMLEIYKVIE